MIRTFLHKLGTLACFLAAFCALVFSTQAQTAPKSELWDIWQEADESNTQLISHSEWQFLLDSYLKVEKGAVSLFDYGAVSEEDSDRLDIYLMYLQSLDPRDFASNEQQAYWINLYNALTVQLILENYPVRSITKLGKGFFKFGPWDDEVAEVAGKTLTLNDIEHRILRPIWQDSRIHFAVNCASIGCPNLQSTAFTSENMDELLEQAAKEYLSHSRGANFDKDGNLKLSSIFDWYAVDFGDDQSEILAFLSRWAPEDVAEKMRSYSGHIDYDYDWDLNELTQ